MVVTNEFHITRLQESTEESLTCQKLQPNLLTHPQI